MSKYFIFRSVKISEKDCELLLNDNLMYSLQCNGEKELFDDVRPEDFIFWGFENGDNYCVKVQWKVLDKQNGTLLLHKLFEFSDGARIDNANIVNQLKEKNLVEINCEEYKQIVSGFTNILKEAGKLLLDVSLVDNEPAFRDWMAQQKKDNGEPYASTTIDQECSRLKNATGKDSIKDIIPCENLFEIDDVESIDNVRKNLENKIAGDESVKSKTDGLPNALNLYYQFLVQKNKKVYFKSDYSSDKFRNRIIFGAPGTGKSNTLNKDKDAELSKQGGEFERVTFHPDYSYAQFVGCYKPKMNGGKIEYSFVPGPFIRVLREALKNCMSVKAGTGTAKPYLLIIEELNRAKTAAVFGDVFQLLDRGDDGVSEYDIQTSEDLRKYLAQELGVSEDAVASIKIPDNMFIWATMNSADQGVFPLDTAFKRRWNFEYIGVDGRPDGDDNDLSFNVKHDDGRDKQNEVIYWDELRRSINNYLSGTNMKVHEDKLLGPFYIKKPAGVVDAKQFNEKCIDLFCDKVLMYLFDDVVKTRRDKLFTTPQFNRFSEIRNDFLKRGTKIFVKEVATEYEDLVKSRDRGSTETAE